MAARRRGPRQRQQRNSQTLVTVTSAAVVIFTLCLCAFNFDLNGEIHPRLETCRLTCDQRLQSAALESHVPSSASPSASDALFHLREAESHSKIRGRVAQPSGGNQANSAKQPMQARPRRLPTLIKILTGFGDEPGASEAGNNGQKPIIARIERPDFIPQVHKRHADAEPLSHEETVQIAAAAAAAAVFSKSIRIFGNNRMHRVNSEWDAALRWIAGWDQQQQQMPPSSLDGVDSEPTANEGGVSSGTSQEGYNSFVDDLARMLDSCITQCVEDEQFEARLEKEGTSEVARGSLSVGNVILKSIFGWLLASSFPRISFGKLDMISSESIFILCRTVQFVGSSLALCALHSLWMLVSPPIYKWYSSLGYSESPEWLLEHEKEIQLAKTSRSRQKKRMRRKQSFKQAGTRKKVTPGCNVTQKESMISGQDELGPNFQASHIESAPEPVKVGGKLSKSGNTSVKERGDIDASDGRAIRPAAVLASKDSTSVSQDSSEGVPSIISYSTTSASSSPSLKPIGHSIDQDIPYGAVLQGPAQPVGLTLHFGRGSNSQFGRPSPLFAQRAHPKALPVPTQEQRDEAAKQLREFQNAQIQRIITQRKLSQSSHVSRFSTSPPPCDRLISGTSFNSAGTIAPKGADERTRVMRPPPGLMHPSRAPSNPFLPNQDDMAFLTDNELFLSKLLDEDEEDSVEASPSPHNGIESMSPESSLDPSAAPFVGKTSSSLQPEKCAFPKTKYETGDAWQPQPGALMKGNSAVKIKGVYGGSVW